MIIKESILEKCLVDYIEGGIIIGYTLHNVSQVTIMPLKFYLPYHREDMLDSLDIKDI